MDSRIGLRFGLAIVSTCVSLTAVADHRERLADAFEGRAVVVLLDMPATASGVNVYPERRPSLDVGDYRYNLREYGVALSAGTPVVVTKVKVKDDLIEFQLGGGGYGTFLDVLGEGDTPWERAAARARRFDAGSRINVRFEHGVPARALTPRGLRDALAEFVEFRGSGSRAWRERWDDERGLWNDDDIERPRCRGAACDARDDEHDLGPRAADLHADAAHPRADLRTGLTRAEVEARLGPPRAEWRRTQGDLQVVVCSYGAGGEALEAEFVEDVLVRLRPQGR
jgi:hypothetical protein